MSKRTFILLIITLVLIILGFFLYSYFNQRPVTPGDATGGTNFFARFNPFSGGGTTPGDNTGNDTEPEPIDITETPNEERLVKVSSVPIAGYTVFEKERYLGDSTELETAPFLRYVGKAGGVVYQTFADYIQERKFSGLIIPKVYEAQFGKNGETVIMRYLKNGGQSIETFVGTLPKEELGGDMAPITKLDGYFLPENVTDVSISPDKSQAFYIFENIDSAVGVVLDLTNGSKSQILDSAFTEWLSQWGTNNSITLTTKPSSSVPGHTFTLNINDRSLINTLGNINGITTLASPDGNKILFSGNNLALSIYNVQNKTTTSVGLRTLPEKCTWAGSVTIYCAVPKTTGFGEYPDSWYMGEISFNDRIWKVNTDNGELEMLVDPIETTSREEVDAIKLMMDTQEKNLLFVNKKDPFLWRLKLTVE